MVYGLVHVDVLFIGPRFDEPCYFPLNAVVGDVATLKLEPFVEDALFCQGLIP